MKKVVSKYNAPAPHWVGDGFPAKTLFSYQGQGQLLSPFLLLDDAGPMEFLPSEHRRGVGVHPHRGFETVTIVYQGEVAHKDSTGEQGLIGPGDLQWMTAGSGILHEEYHSQTFSQQGGVLDMVQLWVNLPKSDKLTQPNYQTITASTIPRLSLAKNAGQLRVIAGELDDVVGPAKTFSPLLVVDGKLNASAHYHLPLPEGWSGIIIVRRGQLTINEQPFGQNQTCVLSHQGSGVEIFAQQESELLILSGEPLNDPIVGYGPFVMNTNKEIEQALTDFQSGKFGQMPN